MIHVSLEYSKHGIINVLLYLLLLYNEGYALKNYIFKTDKNQYFIVLWWITEIKIIKIYNIDQIQSKY